MNPEPSIEPAAERNPAIALDRVSKRYGAHWVLTGVTFEIGGGDALLIAGPNGAGKSTLLRILATSIPWEAGSYRIGDHELPADTLEARELIAYSAHRSLAYESLTATENLEVWRSHLRMDEEPGLLGELLHRVGLSRAGATPVDKFSAGMKRRLTLARVLLQTSTGRKRLVILDEPYEQLDRDGFDLVGEIVEELRASGVAVVMATHLIERAMGRASHAIFLDRGETRFAGTPTELIRFAGEHHNR